MIFRASAAATLLGAALFVAFDIAAADVPTVKHVAACNTEAQGAARSSTASPTAKDKAQAADARKGNQRKAERTDPTGRIVESPDPQLDGMDAEGAKDAAYRAAYRVCMRKNGF